MRKYILAVVVVMVVLMGCSRNIRVSNGFISGKETGTHWVGGRFDSREVTYYPFIVRGLDQMSGEFETEQKYVSAKDYFTYNIGDKYPSGITPSEN